MSIIFRIFAPIKNSLSHTGGMFFSIDPSPQWLNSDKTASQSAVDWLLKKRERL